MTEIESGDYDLVVSGSRGHGRLTTEILESADNHVHSHSDVPTMTIDAAETSEARTPRRSAAPTSHQS